jgi:hypothetical protein
MAEFRFELRHSDFITHPFKGSAIGDSVRKKRGTPPGLLELTT